MLRRWFGKWMPAPMMDADGGTGGGGDPAANTGGNSGQGSGGASESTTGAAPPIDYEKIASIVAGKQQVAEDTVLKNYFKQQGLSQEEAQQAMAAFKSEKAKNQPDVSALQQQAQQAARAAQQAMVEKEATLAALTLGIDIKTVPYVLKLADLSQAMGQDGKTNAETIQSALKKVLEDVPALKTTTIQQATGFQVGASGGGGQQQTADQDALKAAFGL